MPASYAHIILTKQLVQPTNLTKVNDYIKDALYFRPHFLELGSLSPDLPAFHKEDKYQEQWTNLMHESNTQKLMDNGIKYLQKIIQSDAEPDDKKYKLISWFLGYVSHVVMDTTIHPIVNCINKASYEEDPDNHLKCELHQDSYIINEFLKVSTDKRASFFKAGAGKCHGKKTFFDTPIDEDINIFWNSMLNDTFNDYYKIHSPEIDNWFERFTFAVNKGAEFASHFAYLRNKYDLTKDKLFPEPNEINPLFIYDIRTPNNRILNYSDIFGEAVTNTTKVWEKISDVLFGSQSDVDDIVDDWNLMTGKLTNENSVFWRLKDE